VRRPAARRAYAHIHESCEIEVIDYSTERIKFRQFNNESFLDFLQTTDRTPPMKVRWINIGVSVLYVTKVPELVIGADKATFRAYHGILLADWL
jgi:hypothetical protein